MSGKTKVVLKAKDGRTFAKIFDTYEEACIWIADRTARAGIDLQFEMANFDKEPTIEIYKEAP